MFVFLGAVAAGTIIGGPLGDKFGRKPIIWVSILGVLPFTLLLPHANPVLDGGADRADRDDSGVGVSGDCRVRAGADAWASTGTVAEAVLRICFRHGRRWRGAVLSKLADVTSITLVYEVCAFLPLLGLLAAFLPRVQSPR